ncbi:MAG: phenylalanine--tRNA ligase subunit beta, partial [Bacteroidetes bacterium]|nr:phenylalanine--tRNA ligase subunit beta [Bacteroidota bacterium]
MKISYNWLKEFVDFSYSPEELAEILTNTGLEVENTEKIEVVKGALAGVVVGEVLSCSQHPDADKLYVTQVYTGQEALQIVCGAPNVSKGQKVLVATVGSTIYPFSENPVTIKKAKIRGI